MPGMPLEPKDVLTISLSSAALILSLISFGRSRLDAKIQALRTFQQKRFEAFTNITQAKVLITNQWLLTTNLRIEANRKGDSHALEVVRGIESRSNELRERIAPLFDLQKEQPSYLSLGLSAQLIRMEEVVGRSRALIASLEEQEKILKP